MMDKFVCINDFKNSAGDVIFKIDFIYDGKSDKDEVEMISGFSIIPIPCFITYVFSSGNHPSAWVYSEHFITLAEYRDRQIDEIIS